jgi:hypothetical protein
MKPLILAALAMGALSASLAAQDSPLMVPPLASTPRAIHPQPPARSKGWAMMASTDEMTDAPMVLLALAADARISTPGGFPKMPNLIITCSNGSLGAVVTMGAVIDNESVQFRFGNEEPETQSWSKRADLTKIGPTWGVAGLIRKLATASVFRIKVSLYMAGAPVVTFKPQGLAVYIPQLQAACPGAGL